MKILNLKYVTMYKYQNIKICLQKTTLQIRLRKFFCLNMLKILFHGQMLLVLLMAKKLLERLTKKNYKKQIKKSLDLKSNQERK